MNIDFPLVLVILVCGSGLIWLFDLLFSAGSRRERIEILKGQFPDWQDADSSDAKRFVAAVEKAASEPIIVEYARSFFPVLTLVFVLRSFLFEPFQIPSSSMVPTLTVGDYILVNKFNYGIRLPVVRTKVFDLGEPERGDVMVFFPPHQNKTYYIKRVIGIPGDTIEYRNKQLFLNGEIVPQKWLAMSPDGRFRSHMGVEQLEGERHRIQVSTARPARDFSVKVKPDHYFMMGDNRDNSSDSRVWGQVSERDIVGKAVAIWMHWESVFSIPSFDRVGWID